ncbi:hypothetical protein MC885_003908 [Smutsia gigantea]|nr:hypothetical protein MC885_003908 [Smutsia gigantea]
MHNLRVALHNFLRQGNV